MGHRTATISVYQTRVGQLVHAEPYQHLAESLAIVLLGTNIELHLGTSPVVNKDKCLLGASSNSTHVLLVINEHCFKRPQLRQHESRDKLNTKLSASHISTAAIIRCIIRVGSIVIGRIAIENIRRLQSSIYQRLCQTDGRLMFQTERLSLDLSTRIAVARLQTHLFVALGNTERAIDRLKKSYKKELVAS